MPQTSEQSGVPKYLGTLLRDVQRVSGYPLALVEECKIGYDSETRFATPARPIHEIAYSPEYREFALHFLTNGALKILRFWEQEPAQRLLPATDVERRLPAEDERELAKRVPSLHGRMLERMSTFLQQGLVRQLISVPGDIRVEQEIRHRLPEHRTMQDAYVTRQLQDLEPHFVQELAEACPERIYAASTAMNIVLVTDLATLLHAPIPEVVQASPHSRRAKLLHHALQDVPVAGYTGDRLATDAWAAILDLEGRFEWQPLQT